MGLFQLGRRCLCGVSMGAFTFMLLGGTASAQEASEDGARDNQAEIIVTGTRRAGITAVESARPVDIVSSDTLSRQGSSNINDALKTAVPSLNVQKFVAQDGSAFVRPFSLRGLPPDQTLVLVNNKRRHRSALVQITNQPLAAGAQGADLSVIPSIAIKSIEVLRDGAAAQYGSDAIAGVINFRLKDASEGLELVARYGQYYEGDGEDYTVQANAGLPLTADGFFNISGEYVRSKPTSRGAQRPDAQALIDAGNTAVPVPAQRWGNVNSEAARLFINAEVATGDDATAYLFGNYSWSTGDTEFFYRNPAARPDVFGSVPLTNVPGGPRFSFATQFPGGFTPVFGTEIKDLSLAGGLKGETRGLNYDFSAIIAQNSIQYKLSNTINPSLGPDSPTSFRPGKVAQRETQFHADFSYPWETGVFAEPLNIAFGAEFRRETFEITAGDVASYIAGPYARVIDPDTGQPIGLAVGSSGFPGYDPSTAGTFSRSNWAAYVDLEGDVARGLTLGLAGRFEDFSDFGSTFNWKASGRYEITDWFALRGSVSTGFRAPTPGQSNISDVATNVDLNSGGLLLTATRPPTDPVAQFYGARPLDREKSKNIAAGVVFDLPGGWVFTVDYFNIKVEDRIALTSRIPITAADRAAMLSQGIDPGDVQSVRFFGNFFDTKTEGVDAVFSKNWRLDSGLNLGLTASLNYTKNRITNVRDPRAVDRERRIEISAFNPKWRGNITASAESGPFSAQLRASYYGKWTDAVPNAVPTPNAFDQTFDAQWLVDLEVSYDLTENFRLAVGADNLFDVYPDKDLRPGQTLNGIVYPQFSPFGFSGGFWYARGTMKF
ncbi:MAG: TonB-dependent receptor [Dechloromonas sp.]|uniref:TonB-dependent receptor plug domain-containing protein n=1 Tax=Sphingopyxis sp. SCN 67-31 TaxID=1660142 RepID=UPI000A653360|nr:TonB-dependent receptor [Sphingopyxis sp. SCN 67-31]KAB2916102.1 MAG: TonB-dependent receptor [Dechloromonas sp.]